MKLSKITLFLGSIIMSSLAFAEYSCQELGLIDCPNQVDKQLPDPHDMLTWTPEQRVIGFRNTYRSYDGSAFHPDKNNILKLNKYEKPITNKKITYSIGSKKFHLNDYLKRQVVVGLIILKDGKIAYEYYKSDNDATTLWTSRSIAKSIVATLVGIAIKQGKIHSLEDPIIQYLPDLKGTAWEKVTLRQLMQHTSGVEWDENYKDPQSDFAKMTYCEVEKDPNTCVYENIKKVKTKYEPGTVWSYNTGGAFLVGKVLEAATHENIAAYLEKNVWKKVGMEKNGIWQSYKRNVIDMGGHGFNATLRDYARLGVFISNEGRLSNGEKLLPDGWTKEATNWTKAKGSVSNDYPNGQYGFQWWSSHAKSGAPLTTKNADATLWGFGIFGQMMAINPKDNIVMIQWSTWDTAIPSEPIINEKSLFFNAVTNYLTR
ncbi:serine hydrolase [Acinetobacter sp. CE-15]|uniref:serine hydrolase n=1 Tax=Acinetobacter sp. CE-15 TaxID=3425693 RepID=UPI003DA6C33C